MATAHQICVLTAFSLLPMKRLIRRCCLIHLKNHSTCQQILYSAAISSVQAGPCCWSGTPHFADLRVFEADMSQFARDSPARCRNRRERCALISDDAGTPINLHRVHSVCVHFSFGWPAVMVRNCSVQIRLRTPESPL